MGCSFGRESELYSREVQGSQQPGQSAIYRCSYVPEVATGIEGMPEIKTMQDFYLWCFETHANNVMHGTRGRNKDGSFGEYEWRTYAEVEDICLRVGSGLKKRNLVEPVKGAEFQDEYRFVALYSKNREEWSQVDIACCLFGLTLIPLYDTLGLEAMDHVFNQTSVGTVFCSGENVEKLLKGVEDKHYHSLKNIISFDELNENTVQRAQKAGINLIDWEELLYTPSDEKIETEASSKDKKDKKDEEEEEVELPEVTPESIFTFNYTSGTTSLPKAVVISHANVIGAVAGYTRLRVSQIQDMGDGDIYISYLPLAHVLERMFQQLVYQRGAGVGYFSGDIMKLKDDLAVLKPTIMTAVPRMLNRFYDLIISNMNKVEGWKKGLLERGIASKTKALKDSSKYTNTIYDTLVFKKMQASLGGKVRLMLCGGAPLSPEIGEFLKVAFGCPIIEGYGLTETCAVATIQRPEDTVSGNVGGPVPSAEIKLVDIPEMNYTHEDKNAQGEVCPRGEICIRGPTVFKGYYKDKKETEAAIDSDGWFHTGDVGRINPDGSLSVIDRKKNIFKLAQGEYIAPEKIENVYVTSKYATEAFVYGDSFKATLVGIIVPNKDNVLELAQSLGIQGSYENICSNPKVVKEVLNELTKCGKEAGLHSFEQVKTIALEPVSFVIAGLCTPSLKLKRANAKIHYQSLIDQLYKA